MEAAIEIKNLSKQYRIGLIGTGTLSHDLNRFWYRIRGKEDPYLKVGSVNTRSKSADNEYVWALKNINLKVNKGEVVGIIGKNGAGKSTLLKILSRVTGPTMGEINYRGRIGALLEVGTGFHPELTGRENIYLNGAILGMTKGEISNKFDRIVDFSGCARYVDTPTKRYSSGMIVRLGFAVASYLEPEILVVDEVLAVGDAEFQKKAIGKMEEVSHDSGRTILLVSHNMSTIKSLCNRVVLLQDGTISKIGNPEEIVSYYLNFENKLSDIPVNDRKDRKGNQKVKITNVEILDDRSGKKTNVVQSGDPILIRIKYKAINYPNKNIRSLIIGLPIIDGQERFFSVLNNMMSGYNFTNMPLEGELICKIEKLPLMYGEFYFNINLHIDGELSDSLERSAKISVTEGDYFNSGKPNSGHRQGIYINQYWNFNGK